MELVEIAVAVGVREHANLHDKMHPDYLDKKEDRIAFQTIARKMIVANQVDKHTQSKVGFFNYFFTIIY